ncbi:hypothetical protein STANM309S_00678 [Streptomyces tanashiensis]
MTRWRSIRRAASTAVQEGRAVTAGLDIMASAELGPSFAAWRLSRSASETTPTGRFSSSTTGTAVMPYSSRSRAISLNDVPRCTATAVGVIRSATLRCLIVRSVPSVFLRP